MSTRLRLATTPAVIVLALATLVGATSAHAGPALLKDDGFITAETPGVLGIEGGECFDDPAYEPSADEVMVLYRPCTEGADNQVYAFVRVPDADAWDPHAVRALGRDGCTRYFDRLWPSGATGLHHYPILPTAETWADGDRTIMCAVYRPGRDLTDSVLP